MAIASHNHIILAFETECTLHWLPAKKKGLAFGFHDENSHASVTV